MIGNDRERLEPAGMAGARHSDFFQNLQQFQ